MLKPIIIILILVFVIIALGYGLYYFNFLNKDSNTENQEEEPLDISNDLKEDTPKSTSDTIDTKKGEKFLVVLDSNPTTGYSWEVSLDSNYVQLDDRNFASEASEGMVGAGGEETFNFTALESGNTEITFSYLRSWEKDVEPVEKKMYNIIIE